MNSTEWYIVGILTGIVITLAVLITTDYLLHMTAGE